MSRLFPALLGACLLLAACASGRPPQDAPPPLDVAALERALHDRLNAARRAQGLEPLGWNTRLHALARRHSRDMAARGFFSHVNPRGEDVNDRGTRAGLACRKRLADRKVLEGFGENLFTTARYASYRDVYRVRGRKREHLRRQYTWKTPRDLARETVAGWLESPGHRAVLLHPAFETQGLGVAVAADGQVYVTQNLC